MDVAEASSLIVTDCNDKKQSTIKYNKEKNNI